MSEQNPLAEWSKERVRQINERVSPEPPSEPVKIETDGVFDSELLDSAGYPMPPEIDSLLSDPMGVMLKMLGNYFDSMRPRAVKPIKTEHKVRIFQINDRANLEEIAAEIEALLNDGYCCHMPTPCGDFLIMNFSRRKETEEK